MITDHSCEQGLHAGFSAVVGFSLSHTRRCKHIARRKLRWKQAFIFPLPDVRQVSRSPTNENEGGVVNKLDEAIEREVRPWLDLVDSLRAQGIQDELSLPQV